MAPPKVDDEYRKQIENARKNLDALISQEKDRYAPLMLRLALHDAGIYGIDIGANCYLIKRGPNSSIKTKKELDHPSNKGLKAIVDRIEDEVKKKNDKITYADLYQLAGVAAVKIAGGPEIKFVPGREDSTQDPEESGVLPANKLDESVLEKITKRMGLEEKDMVALVGGLCQWDPPVKSAATNDDKEKTSDDKRAQDSFRFDNSYFRDLKKRDQNNPLLKVEGFRKWVETYAEKEDSFKNDYAVAHKKVSELGMSIATSAGKEGEGRKTNQNSTAPTSRKRLVQGIGLAVVTTAIIIGFILSRRSK